MDDADNKDSIVEKMNESFDTFAKISTRRQIPATPETVDNDFRRMTSIEVRLL